ncbi:MAG: DUF4375 domain-containing protein [Clostridia bacterium]|nr:DUF4375 domain-containing protein [Clostridia bacterium]
MKKMFAVLIILVCFSSSFVVYADTNGEYNCSDWAKESIDRAFNTYLLDGEKEYEFKTNISRLDFCELIFNLVIQTPYFQTWCEENPEGNGEEFPSFIEKSFVDTEAEEVLFLHHIGIINGKTETEFAPNDNLTREEAATIIVRMIDIATPMEATEVWYEYNDLGDISDWAMSPVQRISNLGFMKGVGENKFAPKDTYTTEQAVVTVVRVFDANYINWIAEIIKKEAGELGYVYENDTWNYVTYDMAVGRRVKPIDVNKDEFKVHKNEKFAFDNKNVYLMGNKIEDADPMTFQIITDDGKMRYAKDKKSVYIYLEDGAIMKVIGADPGTFEVLDYPYAKDKNDAYNGCLPLYVDDVTKFEVVESGDGWTRISFPDSFLTTALNSKEVAEYNNKKYGFIDTAVIYSEQGKAKTEKLIYEGYRIMEEKTDIWTIEEKENFIVEMSQYIAEKCEYGDNMGNLNEEQRVFYITQALEMEVNNGGFSQFFFNSDGCFGNEIVSSFEKIGAMKTAEICKKAISIYGDKVPTDRDEREDVLTPDDEKEEERIEEILNECDDAFFEYEDDLLELNYQFIINNKESFLK